MAPLEKEIRTRLGDFIFGSDDQTYEGMLSALLRESGLTLAVAETSFGSSIIQTVKSMEGGAEFFRLGLTLLNPGAAKSVFQGFGPIPAGEDLLGPEASRWLAGGVRSLAGSDLGLALTGRTGREKGQDHQVHIALAHARGTEIVEQRWPFAMRFIENRMTKMALEQIRKHLLESQISR
jgi:nicotinamide-nucleotide amidase